MIVAHNLAIAIVVINVMESMIIHILAELRLSIQLVVLKVIKVGLVCGRNCVGL